MFGLSKGLDKMVNKLAVKNMRSRYVEVEHPTILIDGRPLDFILDEVYPDHLLLGLVPMIIEWISLEEEVTLVGQAYESDQVIKILPILMCPDDCDLTCTLVVVEVEIMDDLVHWKRFGIDKNKQKEFIKHNGFLETNVEWLNKVPSMTFYKEDYKTLDKIYKHL